MKKQRLLSQPDSFLDRLAFLDVPKLRMFSVVYYTTNSTPREIEGSSSLMGRLDAVAEEFKHAEEGKVRGYLEILLLMY